MVTNKPKYILIAPLDWGLGHASRCAPIIRHILSLGHIPVFAGNASQRSFIEKTFEHIEVIDLEGYNISYSHWNKWAQIGLLSQIPGINKTIQAEHKWLLRICGERKIDGIISDNRYGLFHPHIPSVILTHQLQVQTGVGAMADRIIQKIHYKYLQRFKAIWVADAPGNENLGGKLSHPGSLLPRNTTYVGLLSRFAGLATREKTADNLLILLSGPEPQRTAISRLLWQQAIHYRGRVTFVEGSESAQVPVNIPEHITHYRRLTDRLLGPVLQDAGIVICRSGYSTLMDLAALQKRAILIPTPGQTEQEYLGRFMRDNGIFYSTQQKGFDLRIALDHSSQFPYRQPISHAAFELYQKCVEDWILTL